MEEEAREVLGAPLVFTDLSEDQRAAVERVRGVLDVHVERIRARRAAGALPLPTVGPADCAAVPGLSDSGRRETFGTGSVRDSREGKGRYDLLPFDALDRVARIYELGAAKYEDRNWEKGQPISRFLDSALRHLGKYLRGLEDEDHLAQAAWNVLGALAMEERAGGSVPRELLDLPRHR